MHDAGTIYSRGGRAEVTGPLTIPEGQHVSGSEGLVLRLGADGNTYTLLLHTGASTCRAPAGSLLINICCSSWPCTDSAHGVLLPPDPPSGLGRSAACLRTESEPGALLPRTTSEASAARGARRPTCWSCPSAGEGHSYSARIATRGGFMTARLPFSVFRAEDVGAPPVSPPLHAKTGLFQIGGATCRK